MHAFHRLSLWVKMVVAAALFILLLGGIYVLMQDQASINQQEQEGEVETVRATVVASFPQEQLEVISLKKISTDTYIVEGTMYIDDARASYPVILTVTKQSGVWEVADIQKLSSPSRE